MLFAPCSQSMTIASREDAIVTFEHMLAELCGTPQGHPSISGVSLWQLPEQQAKRIKNLPGCSIKSSDSNGVMFRVLLDDGEAFITGKVRLDRGGIEWLEGVTIVRLSSGVR